MNKTPLRCTAVAFFLFWMTPQVCLANPVPLFPSNFGHTVLVTISLDAIVDLVVLAAGFALVNELRHFRRPKFLGYFLAVVVGGLVVDFIGFLVLDYMAAGDTRYKSSTSFLVSSFCVYALGLALYNTTLCAGCFKIALKKTLIIGLAMGILTCPILWKPVVETLSPAPDNPYHFTELTDGYNISP